MLRIDIDSLDDLRVAAYRNLKDRELAREGDRFIAEGEAVVRRMLASPRHPAESLLCASSRVGRIETVVPDGVPIYVAPDAVVNEIIGFRFHSGIMAVGVRPASSTLQDLFPPDRSAHTVLCCPNIANTDNLGALLRIAAGFGCSGVLLGEECCDPYYRQAVRVSMGAVFALPIVRSADIRRDLVSLQRAHECALWATVLDDDASALGSIARPRRLCLLMGNEAQGLERDIVGLCDQRVTIPMRLGTDSLNVAVSAGVFLYELTRDRSASCG